MNKKQIAAVLLVLVVAAFAGGTLAQGPALPPGEYDLEEGQYVFNVPGLAPTDTPVAPTDTPLPPSPTPEAHDRTIWHPVSADISHTHNADPNSVNHIFGPPGAWHNGQEISHPWQTWQGLDADPLGPSSGVMENDIKHEGYKWSVEEFANCENNVYLGVIGNCVMAYRLLHHAVGGPVGANVRLHSYSLEMLICTPDLSQCGILRTGGHADYGRLMIPPPGGGQTDSVYVALPHDPPEFATQGNPASSPYKHHKHIDDGRSNYAWQVSARYGWNRTGRFAFRVFDDWQGINPDDTMEVRPLGGENNNSTTQVYRLYFNAYPNRRQWDFLDTDGDGILNFSGFTDRQGNLVADCAPLGPDCIPFILNGVPLGETVFRRTGPPQQESIKEYDLSPAGESWIRWPN